MNKNPEKNLNNFAINTVPTYTEDDSSENNISSPTLLPQKKGKIKKTNSSKSVVFGGVSFAGEDNISSIPKFN